MFVDIYVVLELGFVLVELLALAAGEHVRAMVWGAGLEGAPATVHFGPEAGASSLTASITYAGGEARLMRSEPAEGGYDGCGDHIEVDVEVVVTSAGDALKERFVAPLRGSTAKVAVVRQALALADLAGELALTQVEPATAEVGALQLELGFTEVGLFGGASARVEVTDGPTVAATALEFARWPGDDTCIAGEVPLPLDAALAGFAGADALAFVGGAAPMEIAWAELGTVALGFEFTHDGAPVCARYEGDALGELRLGAQLDVYSGDERWMGRFPVELVARPRADGGLARVELALTADQARGVPVASFAATYGLDVAHLESYDLGVLELSGVFTPASGGARADGRLSVFGVTAVVCDGTNNSCAGP